MNKSANASQEDGHYLVRTAEQRQAQKQLQYSPKKEFAFQFSEDQEVEKVLRQPRTRAYMEVFDAVDMLSAEDEAVIERLKAKMDQETMEEFSEMSAEELLSEIKDCFEEEFLELEIDVKSVLLGVLAKCYITGCDCHAITPNGDILAHFQQGGELPEDLKKGRTVLRKYPECQCVEVYTDCCRVIDPDGTVTKIRNKEIE